MKKILFLLCLGSSVVFTSCKKDDDPTKKEMLVGKNWVATAMTIDPGLPIVGTNLFNQVEACDKDDITKFSADGKATFDEGATKCEVTDPQTTTGSWALNPTETILSITYSPTSTISLTLKTLTSSKMVGTYQVVDSGVTYTYELTFEAK
jgi:hypothetical protein